MDSLEFNENINLVEFSKIIKDLLNDLNGTFRDKVEDIIKSNRDLNTIYKFDITQLRDHEDENSDDDTSEHENTCEHENASEDDNDENENKEQSNFLKSVENVYKYCKTVYPERFFDIIYQNEEIYDGNCNTYFLPGINFIELFMDPHVNRQIKETLWKYLQLILFSIITSVDNKESFGSNAQLFEAIASDEFKNKLEQTMKDMEKLFTSKMNDTSDNDISGCSTDNDSTSTPNFNFSDFFESMNTDDGSNNMPNTDSIFSHINGLINGKIGSLAKELAEETTKDLDLDTENINDVNDVFQQLFKNPTKLMGLVSNIGNKLDKKMKDGSIKESELLEEATSIFKNMKSMPGMDNFDQLFKSMNLDQFMPKGAKFNQNAFQSMMDTNIKMSKTKERMKKKAEQKAAHGSSQPSNFLNPDSNNLNDINSNLATLMSQMQNMPNMPNMPNIPLPDDIARTFLDPEILKHNNLYQSPDHSEHQHKSNKKKRNKKK